MPDDQLFIYAYYGHIRSIREYSDIETQSLFLFYNIELWICGHLLGMLQKPQSSMSSETNSKQQRMPICSEMRLDRIWASKKCS